ncbi:MAG: hypothetical protein ABR584_12510 [Candidatus Baltobacteraceae bacterium]
MQRAIERRDIPTVSVTVARDITERVKAPRALFLPFRMGHHFGVPHHRTLQREIVVAALGLLETTSVSGEVAMFPKTWAQARAEGRT